MTAKPLRAPFPWFGGKSRAAHLVWAAFGDVANYVEPFAGSLAVLLARPGTPRVETVNDLDCYLANFWRALAAAPLEVAAAADWPVNEADLHARHRWLVAQTEFRERMKVDPDYYEVKVAGWWVWGLCQWIGGGWCSHVEWTGRAGGRGLSRQLPDLSGDGGAAGRGVHASAVERTRGGVDAWMLRLAERLRRVRVCCGDWKRVLGPAVTTCIGTTGVLLDPPYGDAKRAPRLYAHDSMTIAGEVREWAIANGEDPGLRIALCGYEGEHDMPEGWRCVAWKAIGGYGAQRADGTQNENAGRERIWFSPHCQAVLERQPSLFGAA